MQMIKFGTISGQNIKRRDVLTFCVIIYICLFSAVENKPIGLISTIPEGETLKIVYLSFEILGKITET